MSLTPEDVRKVARLARLELSDAEVETMARQLSAIVDYVGQLQRLDLEGVEPLSHALDVSNVFRADEPAPSLTVEQALSNAPQRQRDFFRVPAVLDSAE
jgi:aspartyl-tRNA(Asn)/glutamyl-tRNA(Gln) amidotransferase subunit C